MTAPAATSGTSEAPSTASTDPAGAPADAQAASTSPPAGQAAEAPKTVDDLPDWAQKIVRDARTEAAGSRTAGKTAAEQAEQALVQRIGKSLGLIKDDEPADAAKLQTQIEEHAATAREAKVELAVHRAAGKAGADADALLDSRAFLGALKDIDPDDAAAVTAAIAEAIKTNPKLKVGQAPGASGVDHSGGSGEGAHTLDAQIAEATKAGNHGLAIALKRQAAATT